MELFCHRFRYIIPLIKFEYDDSTFGVRGYKNLTLNLELNLIKKNPVINYQTLIELIGAGVNANYYIFYTFSIEYARKVFATVDSV